ncbi:MAG: type-F conjugative transfer system pilin assembly protein TrbC [Gammaproteobacteria bacterium]|nr:type-F conjugative transfer system pilin assembly protein TrbC [Gammaproteobacteria bacterium]
MLRILTTMMSIGLCLMTAPTLWAATPTGEDLNSATTRSQDAVEQARRLSKDEDFNRQIRINGEQGIADANRASQDRVSGSASVIAPVVDVRSLTKAQEDIRALLADPQLTIPQDSTSGDGDPPPLVFISFSMPDDSLRALLRDAERTGSPLVLRGMVDNSMKRTVERIGELLGTGKPGKDVVDGPAPSLAIDPTLFERFGVDKVPTFILLLDAAAPCTPAGCPVPDHLKLAGDVSLAYALGVMAREGTGTPLGLRAEQWHKRLEAQP